MDAVQQDREDDPSVLSRAVVNEVKVRFMRPRLGIFFADTRLGDVVVADVDSQSEASGRVDPGMVLTCVAGKRLRRSMPTVAAQALLKQKSARPLTLGFSSHRRQADMPHKYQTKLCRPMPLRGESVSQIRRVHSAAASSERKRAGAARPRARLQLCGSRDSARNIRRNEEWFLALDASDLLCRRRIFNR